MVKADLHNHLRTSSASCDGDFNKVVDIAAKRLGEDAIVGLANFGDDRYERFSNLQGYDRVFVGEDKNGFYIPEKKVLIVKEQEVPTSEGHLLVLGLRYGEHVKQNRSLADTLSDIQDRGAGAVADHPFYLCGIGESLQQNLEIIEKLDAIEVHNGEASLGFPIGPLPWGANRRAQKFYEEIKKEFPHLGALASSDGHSMYELGRSWTEIEMPDLQRNFVTSLRDSIKQTHLRTPKQMRSAIFGAMDHIMDLIFLTKIAPKLGLA